MLTKAIVLADAANDGDPLLLFFMKTRNMLWHHQSDWMVRLLTGYRYEQ